MNKNENNEIKEIECSVSELKFLKSEQKYMESKINNLLICVISFNSFLFVGTTQYIITNKWYPIVAIIILLLPSLSCLIGLFPKKWLTNNSNDKNNIFSKERQKWCINNYMEKIEYQINICFRVIKYKKKLYDISFFIEIFSIIICLIVLLFNFFLK